MGNLASVQNLQKNEGVSRVVLTFSAVREPTAFVISYGGKIAGVLQR